MKKHFAITFTILFFGLLAISCGGGTKQNTTEQNQQAAVVEKPQFSGDSAYRFVAEQVAFGPRVPESEAHAKCRDYLAGKLEQYGAKVTVQKGTSTLYNGRSIPIYNVIGEMNPDAGNRVLLMAHWDSRPFADEDSDPAKRRQPILGANDGASGVGVLLEVARLIDAAENTDLGVDIVFFDVEDYGHPSWEGEGGGWCLGSKYWAENPHRLGYRARYGILLDMVGAPNAQFFYEHYSQLYASSILEMVWDNAIKNGFGGYFVKKQGGAIVDDHLPVNEILKIPSINIIQYNPNTPTRFYEHWHTHKDDMNSIDKNTLYAVGQTLVNVIF